MARSFHERTVDVVRSIPAGQVATYGLVAALAGNPRAARQVIRVLHSSSRKERLPWRRVVNREGRISLRPGHGYEMQKELLTCEGITFDENDRIDLSRFLWHPR